MTPEPVEPIAVPDPINAAAWVLDRNLAEGRGDRPAIHFEGKTWRYRDVQALVNQTGNLLRELGVGMETRAGLLMLDSPEYVAAFLGAVKIGAVPICLNTLLPPDAHAYMLNDARVRVVIAHAEVVDGLLTVRNDLRWLQHIVVVGATPPGCLAYGDLLARASTVLEPEPCSPDDWSFWAYTSGSTGPPKAVMHTHRTLVAGSWYFPRHVLHLTSDDVVLTIAKIFFTYGTGFNMYQPLAHGAATVLNPRRPTPEDTFRLIDRHRPTIFGGVPTMYAGMLQVPDAERRFDTGSLRMCWSGGETLPPPIYREWRKRFGLEILEMLGSSEMIHAYCTTRLGMDRPGSIGVPVPGYELRVVDDELRDVKDGTPGRLMIAGPTTFAGYWNRQDKTRETFWGPWTLSADTVRRDTEGVYWFVGRNDDMLRVGGAFVSPIEIEKVLSEHAAVLEAAVVGAPDEHGLIKPKAFLVLKPAYEKGGALEAELTALAKARLARYAYPRWYVYLDELPKTATGKIQRFKLRG